MKHTIRKILESIEGLDPKEGFISKEGIISVLDDTTIRIDDEFIFVGDTDEVQKIKELEDNIHELQTKINGLTQMVANAEVRDKAHESTVNLLHIQINEWKRKYHVAAKEWHTAAKEMTDVKADLMKFRNEHGLSMSEAAEAWVASR